MSTPIMEKTQVVEVHISARWREVAYETGRHGWQCLHSIACALESATEVLAACL